MLGTYIYIYSQKKHNQISKCLQTSEHLFCWLRLYILWGAPVGVDLWGGGAALRFSPLASLIAAAGRMVWDPPGQPPSLVGVLCWYSELTTVNIAAQFLSVDEVCDVDYWVIFHCHHRNAPGIHIPSQKVLGPPSIHERESPITVPQRVCGSIGLVTSQPGPFRRTLTDGS